MRILPRPVFATPTVAACPLAVFGGVTDAAGPPPLLPPPPQPAASARSGTAAAPARKVIDLPRCIVGPLVERNVLKRLARESWFVVGLKPTLWATPTAVVAREQGGRSRWF